MNQGIARLFVLALLAAMSPASYSQSGGIPSTDTKRTEAKGVQGGKKAQGEVHKGMGVVKKVDPAKGTVTLAHETIKSLGWPAMTMSFTIRDKALFNNLAVDKKVEFDLVQEGKDYVIIAVR
jgi:Cu(I)/Ag(I) efflux system periplasmic protein CusF